MSTLEQAGYVRSPFSTSDVFGAPTGFQFTQVNTTLPTGHDDSALPALADPAYGRPNLSQGSSRAQFVKDTPQDAKAAMGSATTLIFLAALAVLLYARRS